MNQSNEIVNIPNNLPAFMDNLKSMFPDMDFSNDDAMNGLSSSAPPTIALNGTRFVVKENGEETTLNVLELSAVIVRAKSTMSKTWYAAKFTPGQEPAAPDCMSNDGVTPDASSSIKQNPSCAGCPQNEYGSGTDAQGNPAKGKACRDIKILAIFANNHAYKFAIPPASLKNFGTYVKSLTSRGVPLITCVTKISFDPAFSYPVLTFTYGGMLPESAIKKISEVAKSSEVIDIVGVPISAHNVALPAPAPAPEPVKTPEPVKETKPVKKQKLEAVKPPFEEEVIDELPQSTGAVSDEDLAAALGLTI